MGDSLNPISSKESSKPVTPEPEEIIETEVEILSPLDNEKIKRKMRRSKKSSVSTFDETSLYNTTE